MSRKDVPAFAIGRPEPTPAEAAAIEDFVAGGATASVVPMISVSKVRAPTKPHAPKKSARIVRADGRAVKRSVLYLPPELHKRLAVRCAELETTLSDFVADAVTKAL